MSGMQKLTAAGSSRLAAVLAGAALLALCVDAAAGQTPPGQKSFVRTYDVRIVGSVTTTAPDIVFTEKATHVYRGVRIRVIQQSGAFMGAGLVETPRAADTGKPNGAMSGAVAYQEAGSTPCSQSKEFRGPARLEVFGSRGRAFYAAGEWAGKPGGVGLSVRECPGLVDVQGGNYQWLYEKGRISAAHSAGGASFTWLLQLRTRGRLPFPVNIVYAGKSFTATASGTMNDGFGVRKGSLRVTFTARR
jgi:hypothetical protein